MHRTILVSASALGLILSATSSSIAAPPTANVNVTNTESNPVPTVTTNTESNPVPTVTTNTESNPVPTVSVGRTPYQMTYDLFATQSGSEDCEAIPVPEGKLLHITSVGVRTSLDSGALPDVYLMISKQTLGSASYFRFGSDLNLTFSLGGADVYKGIFNLSAFAGETTADLTYKAWICVEDPPFTANNGNSARGVVSGWLIDGTIVDGNTLN